MNERKISKTFLFSGLTMIVGYFLFQIIFTVIVQATDLIKTMETYLIFYFVFLYASIIVLLTIVTYHFLKQILDRIYGKIGLICVISSIILFSTSLIIQIITIVNFEDFALKTTKTLFLTVFAFTLVSNLAYSITMISFWFSVNSNLKKTFLKILSGFLVVGSGLFTSAWLYLYMMDTLIFFNIFELNYSTVLFTIVQGINLVCYFGSGIFLTAFGGIRMRQIKKKSTKNQADDVGKPLDSQNRY